MVTQFTSVFVLCVALVEAKQRKLPIMVVLHKVWCGSCMLNQLLVVIGVELFLSCFVCRQASSPALRGVRSDRRTGQKLYHGTASPAHNA
jgi:hypothetical protein